MNMDWDDYEDNDQYYDEQYEDWDDYDSYDEYSYDDYYDYDPIDDYQPSHWEHIRNLWYRVKFWWSKYNPFTSAWKRPKDMDDIPF